MRSYPIREWILSLVTTPDHAASIIGDLVETGHSPLRIWTAIASSLLHAITPKLLAIALAGLVAQFLVFAIPAIAIAQLGDRISLHQFQWFAVLACLATQMLTGYWLARWNPRRPVFVVLLIALLNCVLGALNINNASVNMALWSLPILAGAILQHRMSLRRA